MNAPTNLPSGKLGRGRGSEMCPQEFIDQLEPGRRVFVSDAFVTLLLEIVQLDHNEVTGFYTVRACTVGGLVLCFPFHPDLANVIGDYLVSNTPCMNAYGLRFVGSPDWKGK